MLCQVYAEVRFDSSAGFLTPDSIAENISLQYSWYLKHCLFPIFYSRRLAYSWIKIDRIMINMPNNIDDIDDLW